MEGEWGEIDQAECESQSEMEDLVQLRKMLALPSVTHVVVRSLLDSILSSQAVVCRS